jgi:hypothetical protein
LNNLIVTIISIVLIAVAAIMAIFYGGAALLSGNIQATANAIINESQQLLLAERMWSANNGQQDISSMPAFTTTYGLETIPESLCFASPTPPPVGISQFVFSSSLTGWPSLAGAIGGYRSGSSVVIGPAPDCYTYGATSFTVGLRESSGDYGCYTIGGYSGQLQRYVLAYNGSNYVVYEFILNYPFTGNCSDVNGRWMTSLTDTITQSYKLPKPLIPSWAKFRLMQI